MGMMHLWAGSAKLMNSSKRIPKLSNRFVLETPSIHFQIRFANRLVGLVSCDTDENFRNQIASEMLLFLLLMAHSLISMPRGNMICRPWTEDKNFSMISIWLIWTKLLFGRVDYSLAMLSWLIEKKKYYDLAVSLLHWEMNQVGGVRSSV